MVHVDDPLASYLDIAGQVSFDQLIRLMLERTTTITEKRVKCDPTLAEIIGVDTFPIDMASSIARMQLVPNTLPPRAPRKPSNMVNRTSVPSNSTVRRKLEF